MKNKIIQLVTLTLGLVALANTAQAQNPENLGFGYGKAADFHLIVNGNKVEFGQTLEKLQTMLGKESNSSDEVTIWRFPNGLTFSATFEKNKLDEASIASSQPLVESYAVVHDQKISLSSYTIGQLENTYINQNYCLSYYQADGMPLLPEVTKADNQQDTTTEKTTDDTANTVTNTAGDEIDINNINEQIDERHLGWFDLQVADSQKEGTYAVFSAVSYSKTPLYTYEGQQQGRTLKIDRIYVTQDLTTYNKNIYCAP